MSKSSLLSSLSSSRDSFNATFEGLSDDLLSESGANADWSVKDVLAHIAAWESELVTLLVREVKRGQKPKLIGISDAKVEELNQKWYEENRGRPLDRVLADYQGVRKQLIRQINDWNEKDLTDTKKYKWLNGKSLADYIEDYANGHDEEHINALRDWRRTHSH
jgi:hypothetical protein